MGISKRKICVYILPKINVYVGVYERGALLGGRRFTPCPLPGVA